MSKKPNLFIVGAPKCGTTAWHSYLSQHPDISFSVEKEPHYFSEDFPNFRWAKSEEQYYKLFENLPNTKYIGEASILYLYSRVAIKNIYEFNPQAKILIFVRSYETFFQSYHSQIYLMHDEEIEDLRQAWDLQPERESGRHIPSTCRDKKFLQYKKVGEFGKQVERVLAVFPRCQVRVIVFEEWIKNPLRTYTEILEFLDLEDNGFRVFPKVNEKRRNRIRWLDRILHRPPKIALATSNLIKKMLRLNRLGLATKIRQINQPSLKEHRTMPTELKEEILLHFKDDKIRLENAIGRKIDSWNSQ